MTGAVLVALAICAASAIAEGLLAGRGVTARFAELTLPRFSPPVWAWALIGLAYYVVCFVVLHYLLRQPTRGSLWLFTFASVVALMVANAGWNYVFFRLKDLRASYTVNVAYNAIAAALFVLLTMNDGGIASIFFLYLVYLTFATSWSYRLWHANIPRGDNTTPGA